MIVARFVACVSTEKLISRCLPSFARREEASKRASLRNWKISKEGARRSRFCRRFTANPASGYGPDFALRSLSSAGAVAAFSHATSAAPCSRCNDLPLVPAHLPQNYILTGSLHFYFPPPLHSPLPLAQPSPIYSRSSNQPRRIKSVKKQRPRCLDSTNRSIVANQSLSIKN